MRLPHTEALSSRKRYTPHVHTASTCLPLPYAVWCVGQTGFPSASCTLYHCRHAACANRFLVALAVPRTQGQHKLTLQFANAQHQSYGPTFSKTITINVQ